MTPPSPAPGPGPGPEAVYAGRVMHQRLRPQRHRLQYRMFSLLLDLQPQRLEALHRRLRWLSVNRFNLFSFHERDHGDGRARGLADWVQQQLRACGQPPASEIRLLAMPRVLGYGFNPLSLFFCHGADGRLHSVIHEVHNTFGERHVYLEPVERVEPVDEEQADGAPVLQACDKAFHVSPFLPMELSYRFRLRPPAADREDFDLAIDVLERPHPATPENAAESAAVSAADPRVLVAHYGAQRQPLTDRHLLRLFATHPLLTLKVIGGIHWEAVKLLLKGLRLHTHPARAAAAGAGAGSTAKVTASFTANFTTTAQVTPTLCEPTVKTGS